MSHPKPARTLIVLLLFTLASGLTQAQTNESSDELKRRVSELIKETKYVDALPLLEKIAALEPNDGETQFYLGFALIAQAVNTKDAATRKELRARGRQAFVKARSLGFYESRLNALIEGLAEDGSDPPGFSANSKADALIAEGQAFFAQGKADEALKAYQQALEADPNAYYAALFSGDIYLLKDDYAQAETWYQKAIAIDPNKETAYRYSATPFMRQGKTDAARDRYVEAFITQPYNRFARAGLVQWAEQTQTIIAHPEIQFPAEISFDDKGDAKVILSVAALVNAPNDGSFAWKHYGITRSQWRKGKFAKTFPSEKVYRHSLAEEAEALRSLITATKSDKDLKKLNPSLAKLKKLDQDGLLEAYVLLALPDDGIAQDYEPYLKQHRDKLRRYVVEYVLKGGG